MYFSKKYRKLKKMIFSEAEDYFKKTLFPLKTNNSKNLNESKSCIIEQYPHALFEEIFLN